MDWSGIDRLQVFGQRAAAVREAERRRQIDDEALRMSIAAQREADTAAQGLMAQALQAGDGPEKAVLERKIADTREPILSRRNQGLQQFLTANLPAAPKRGLGGALERFFSPQVPQEPSQYQQGLIASTLAGERNKPLDYRTPEERMKADYTQSQIEANQGLAQYRRAGMGSQKFYMQTNPETGHQLPWEPNQEPEPGYVVHSVGTTLPKIASAGEKANLQARTDWAKANAQKASETGLFVKDTKGNLRPYVSNQTVLEEGESVVRPSSGARVYTPEETKNLQARTESELAEQLELFNLPDGNQGWVKKGETIPAGARRVERASEMDKLMEGLTTEAANQARLIRLGMAPSAAQTGPLLNQIALANFTRRRFYMDRQGNVKDPAGLMADQLLQRGEETERTLRDAIEAMSQRVQPIVPEPIPAGANETVNVNTGEIYRNGQPTGTTSQEFLERQQAVSASQGPMIQGGAAVPQSGALSPVTMDRLRAYPRLAQRMSGLSATEQEEVLGAIEDGMTEDEILAFFQ